MHIRIHHFSNTEVSQLLNEADAGSFSATGSHDDSGMSVAINGVLRDKRHSSHRWHSMQNSSWDEWSDEPGDLPSIEAIDQASIAKRYGVAYSNVRERTHLRIFQRLNAETFICIELMEVGLLLNTHDLAEMLMSSRKHIKLDATEVACPVRNRTWAKAFGEVFSALHLNCTTPSTLSLSSARDALAATMLGRWLHAPTQAAIDAAEGEARVATFRNALASGERAFSFLNLIDASLEGIDLSGCEFFSCRFDGANLSAANLSGATLSFCHFTGADLSAANLSNAYLSNTEIRDVIGAPDPTRS